MRSKCDECPLTRHAAVILAFAMSTETVDTIPDLSERLHSLQTCSGDELAELASNLSLEGRLPLAFLDGLTEEDKTLCYRVSLLCYCVTLTVQIPREMQLRVVLADQHRKDCWD